jgi:hypothetical protein
MASPHPPVPDPVPHEFIDAEFSVAGLETPADEQMLSSALSGQEGIQSLNIARGKVTVEYDPMRVTKAQLGEVISRAGFRVAEVESGPASAIADALHNEKQ